MGDELEGSESTRVTAFYNSAVRRRDTGVWVLWDSYPPSLKKERGMGRPRKKRK